MFLYELAIELGVRSTDLADRAMLLGMTDVGPSSTLTPSQVQALRADRAPGDAGPAASRAGAPPPLTAPPSWGAPPSTALIPPPPPPAPAELPGPLAAPSGWDPTVEPQAEPPAPPVPPPPAPPSAPAGEGMPTFLAPGAPGWDTAGSTPGTATPADPGPPPPPHPPAPPTDPSGDAGWSKGALAVVGLVALAVVGLFAYMAANTGPDEATKRRVDAARQREAAAAERDAKRPTTTMPPPTTTAPPPTTAAPDPAPKQNSALPVDVETFCDGARGMTAFELRLSAGMIEADLGHLQSLVAEEPVAAWGQAIDQMVSGGAPNLMTDLEFYRAQYLKIFTALRSSSTMQDAAAQLQELPHDQLTGAAWRINNEIADVC